MKGRQKENIENRIELSNVIEKKKEKRKERERETKMKHFKHLSDVT